MLPIVNNIRAQGITDEHEILKQLKIQTLCATECSKCVPYIQRMIQTGETRFEPINFFQL